MFSPAAPADLLLRDMPPFQMLPAHKHGGDPVVRLQIHQHMEHDRQIQVGDMGDFLQKVPVPLPVDEPADKPWLYILIPGQGAPRPRDLSMRTLPYRARICPATSSKLLPAWYRS